MGYKDIDLNQIERNEEFNEAFDALENTSESLFITGKAGTGKSTLLSYFRLKTSKTIAVLAPTGIAAINIQGQTIHSFFHFRPDVTPQSAVDTPIRKRKRQLFAQLDAIVIDEVSMVRADLMDCMDMVLRLHGPHYNKPFGGIQMIFFGDLFQLPPVVTREEEGIFKSIYQTPFFFSANVFKSCSFRTMMLKKIYRQKDPLFIELLNAVRDNALQPHHIHAFNSRFQPKMGFEQGVLHIALTSTNAIAAKVNEQQLGQLPSNVKSYEGIVAGEFDKKSLPTALVLELKVGAQVMLLNNDSQKRWINGTLGVIQAIGHPDPEGEDILVIKLENGTQVDVKRHTWEIYQYYYDEDIQSLSSKVVGYFTQYPVRLAWAVTIHKSQGQTFDRVVIDVGFGTFAHGQMYVALSRATTLSGIILKQPLSPRHILLDQRVVEFMAKT